MVPLNLEWYALFFYPQDFLELNLVPLTLWEELVVVVELEALTLEDEHMDLAWEDRPKVDQHLEEFPKEAILNEVALRSKVSEFNLVAEVVVEIGQVAA